MFDSEYMMEDSSSLKIRRSTRDIKRPKFDDEIVQSVPPSIITKIFPKKRDRNFQSPDYSDLAMEEPGPLMSKVTGGKKKPARQSLDKNGSHEKIVYRESIDSIVQTPKEPIDEKPFNMPDRKRRERIQAASKAIAQQKNAIKSEAENNSPAAQILLNEAFRRWTVQDDVLLVTAVTHVCDLNIVHSSTKFSKPFTLNDIDTRWYNFIYDADFNKATMQRIEQLNSDQLLKIQSSIPFSLEEEQILSEQSMHVSPPSGTFENLLLQHRNVFHHARTPEILEQHWRSMKHWGLLADQTIQNFDDELLRLEREYDMNRFGSDDVLLPTDVEDRNYARDLQNTNQEVEEWEKVLTKAVTGINHAIQFDRDTMAVLKGRCVSFDIRKDRVLIGRSTQKHRVDVNLSYEGPTAPIGRRQGLLRIEPSGRCFLYNLGDAIVYVDRRPIRKTGRGELHNNSMIEIGSIRLLFARNEEMFNYRSVENAPTVQKVEPKGETTAKSTKQ